MTLFEKTKNKGKFYFIPTKFHEFFNFNPKILKFAIYPLEVSKSDNLNLPLIFFIKLDENLWNYVITLMHFFLKGKLHLSLWTLATFADTLLMFKTSHLGVSNFGFLLLYPFYTENSNEIPILPQNYMSF